MNGLILNWFKKMKLPEKNVKIGVMSEGWYGCRLLDKGADYICLHL